MSPLLLFLICGGGPLAWYFWREHKLNTHSLQWPSMRTALGLAYEANPPRLGGEQFRVVWKVPVVKESSETEALLGALCAVADGLESFPKGGGMPSAQAKRP